MGEEIDIELWISLTHTNRYASGITTKVVNAQCRLSLHTRDAQVQLQPIENRKLFS